MICWALLRLVFPECGRVLADTPNLFQSRFPSGRALSPFLPLLLWTLAERRPDSRPLPTTAYALNFAPRASPQPRGGMSRLLPRECSWPSLSLRRLRRRRESGSATASRLLARRLARCCGRVMRSACRSRAARHTRTMECRAARRAAPQELRQGTHTRVRHIVGFPKPPRAWCTRSLRAPAQAARIAGRWLWTRATPFRVV